MRGATLEDCILKNVNLTGADLTGAALKNVMLKDVNFKGANLTRAKLDNATIKRIAEGSTNGQINLDSAILEGDLRKELKL